MGSSSRAGSARSDHARGAASERGLRLDAYLAHAGLASRKEARRLIAGGRVRVGDEVSRDASRRVRVESVFLDDEVVRSPIGELFLLLHKPTGHACSHDEREAPLVLDLLDDAATAGRRVKIAGRLDRETSGLLVLTTDGELVHQLTHPTRKLPKRYRVRFSGTLAEDAVARCRAGLLLEGDDRPTRPAELTLDGEGLATLVLREGRTHQVRRMIRALGGRVVSLHRDRVGRFELPPELAPGAWRPLADDELERLLEDPGSTDSTL